MTSKIDNTIDLGTHDLQGNETGKAQTNETTLLDSAFEYYLGNTNQQTAADFEDAMAVSPAARKAFFDAEELTNKLYLLAPEKTPDKKVWQAIQSRISNQNEPAAVINQKTSVWNKLMPWLVGANGLLAAGLIALVIYPKAIHTIDGSAPMPYTAVLQSQEAEPMWLLQASSDMSELVINNTKALANPNKNQVCILWMESNSGMIPIAEVPVDGSKSKLHLKPYYQQILAQEGKLIITTENMPENNDHSMPDKPSDKMESSGKFLIKDIL